MRLSRRNFIKLFSAKLFSVKLFSVFPLALLPTSDYLWLGWFALSNKDEIRRGNLIQDFGVYDPILDGRGLYILGWDGPPNHEWCQNWIETTKPFFGLWNSYLPVVRK